MSGKWYPCEHEERALKRRIARQKELNSELEKSVHLKRKYSEGGTFTYDEAFAQSLSEKPCGKATSDKRVAEAKYQLGQKVLYAEQWGTIIMTCLHNGHVLYRVLYENGTGTSAWTKEAGIMTEELMTQTPKVEYPEYIIDHGLEDWYERGVYE